MANAKKLVAFILSAVLLLSVLVVPGMFTFAEKDGDNDLDIWNGLPATSFADGSAGTEDDPILVATPEELALVISSGGKGLHYQLTADMYLNDVSESDWYNNADNNAWYANGDFNGHINGAGNIIYGLWYPTTQTGVVGLVPQQTNKDAALSIKNLGIRCARVYSSDSHAGGFLGNSCAQYGITIENCFIDETANIHGGYRSAGFVANIERSGNIVKLDILNCYTKAVVDNVNDNSCGFLGQGYNATFTIRNSYSYGEKIYHSTSSNRNTLSTEEAPFANLYATVACSSWAAGVGTVVSEVNMLGEAAKTNMPGLDYEGVWYVQDGKTPVLRLFKDKLIEPEAPVVGEDGIWNGNIATAFEDDSAGTEEDPIEIRNPGELARAINLGSGHYKLVADIYLNNISASNWYENEDNNAWFADKSFTGSINGDGHIVYGLWYPTTQTGVVGLVPQQTNKDSSLSIKNLGIRYARVYSSDSHAGGFLGESCAQYGITFENCFIDETANIHGGYRSAGFVGSVSRSGNIVKLDILNCYTKAVVDDVNDNSCGFLGQGYNATFTIKNSYCYGERIYHSTSSNRNTLSTDPAPFENLYTTVKGTSWAAGVGIVVAAEDIVGLNARAVMAGLDFEGIWLAAKDQTPVLRQFAGKLGAVEDTSKPVEENGIWTGEMSVSFAVIQRTELEFAPQV